MYKLNNSSNYFKVVRYFIIICCLFNPTLCLYEDQIGKFDWKQNYIGKVKFATFDTASKTPKIIVSTEENVLAALSAKTGQILWRRILEKGHAGHVGAISNNLEKELVVVNSGIPATIRYWNTATGNLLSEWAIFDQNADKMKDAKWHVEDGVLYNILPVYNIGLEVTSYNVKIGEKLKTKKISAPIITRETECELSGANFVCLNENLIFIINIFDPKIEPISITMNTIFGAGTKGPYHLELIPGAITAISVSADNNHKKRVLIINKEVIPIQKDINGESFLFTTYIGSKQILLESSSNNKGIEIKYTDLDSKESQTLSIKKTLYSPRIIAADCSNKNFKEMACKFLMLSKDDSLSFMQENKVLWTREEALAKIAAVEIIELPMSEQEQAIETEFDQKESLEFDMSWDILGMFIRRIASQINQAKSFFQSTLGVQPQQSSQRADLVRDKFGLNKMIVVATSVGKIFGIESKKGEIIWSIRVPETKCFSDGLDKMVLYVQRGSRHFPHPPQCSLLAANKENNNGVVVTFNPITGQLIDEIRKLKYQIKQSMLLHVATENFLRSIVILDEKEKIHIFPENTATVLASVSKSTYLFAVDRVTGVVSGFSLSHSSSENLMAHKTWEVVFSPKTQQITHVAAKNPIEKVHSQGRVLGDRSVLYKYINPNLIAIATQGTDGLQKNTLSLYLLDVVSGSIVFSIAHKRTKGPVHIVHSENWLLYSYFNEKSRRTEIATLELYEGKTQNNNTAFSSLTTRNLPIVERQAFIFPANIDSMQETITEKGITSKHILVALANGGVLELPWMLVDPRRPINPDMREEGVLPYMPEIPIHMDAIVNYNQSIHRISGIFTSPSGLESTCLVFVHGLDLFYTQVAPSKTFDVLKEDFDYYLIVIVLIVLIISSYVTKKLASQKIQKQAWK